MIYMRKFITSILSILFFTTLCFPQYPAPQNKKTKVKYFLEKLEVVDSLFLNELNAIVFQESCLSVNNAKNGFFSMDIDELDCENLSFLIKIEFHKFPFIHNSAYGFFNYKDYTFVLYGDNPKSIFFPTGKSKKIIILKDSIPSIEDFPSWLIKYEDRKLTIRNFDCW